MVSHLCCGGVWVSELDVVLTEAVPLISAAVGAYGAGVLSRVQDVAADATVGLGRRVLERIRHRAAQPAALDAAVADLAQSPQDPDAVGALRLQVRKLLAQDPELLAELAAMLPARGAVTASGEGSIAVGGDSSGINATGDGAVNIQRR